MFRRAAYYSRSGSYSRSHNAELAENQGRCPMTRAKAIVAAEFDCSQVTARAALEFLHDGEWHHVGRYANCVDYHDTRDSRLGGLIAHISECGGSKKWRERREQLQKDRRFGGKLCGYKYQPKPGVVANMLQRKRAGLEFCKRFSY